MEMHFVVLFYKYVKLTKEDMDAIVGYHEEECSDFVGRLLIGEEGLNGHVASTSSDALKSYVSYLCKTVHMIASVDFKYSTSTVVPFHSFMVKRVKEIVNSGGIAKCWKTTEHVDGKLEPSAFHDLLTRDKNVLVLDVRNYKEFAIGHFENAIEPKANTFSEYFQFLDKHIIPSTAKETKIAMYCTGGIRCEKVYNVLKDKGYEQVYHLEGGIHKYNQQFTNGYFQGKNFTFDQRTAMNTDSTVVGQCLYCKVPYDTYHGRKVCTVCRELVLVCETCDINLQEYHCRQHFDLRHCYFTFLHLFNPQQLQQQYQDLQQVLNDLILPGKRNKRRTIQKQMAKILNFNATENPNRKEIPCRTCNCVKCKGDCWGFWKMQ